MSITRINLSPLRSERLNEIRQLFPEHLGPDLSEHWIGGRSEALKRLDDISPVTYGKTRNYLDGDVTRLSPYLRHGCITLPEAIDFAKEKTRTGSDKLLFEFAWRDYWRQVWYAFGERIHSEMEPAKVKLRRNKLPHEIIEAQTTLPCIDSFVNELNETGYLHNHARMWLSSYLIHWLGVDWKIASKWMHNLLLDGDQASNSLSWQWVASTFGSKPYFFNQENLSKYTHNQFCNDCEAICPFSESYESLNEKLFQPSLAPARINPRSIIPIHFQPTGLEHIILFHDEMLSPSHVLYQRNQRKIFVFDQVHYKGWALNRLQFIADCLVEMPDIEVWLGDTLEVLTHLHAGKLETQKTPNTDLNQLLAKCNVIYVEEPEIYSKSLSEKLHSKGLIRFSKYWNQVSQEILR